MNEVVLDPGLSASNQGLASLDALAAQTFVLDPPPRSDVRDLMRNEAGLLLDGLIVRVAKGRGALDVAIGEGLAALAAGDRTLRLGFSGIGDYARERLGIAGRTAQDMARLARALRDRPLLRDAVLRGDVSARKALTILPLARGDAEAAWVARARVETVRALEAAVKAEWAGSPGVEADEDEPWDRLSLPLSSRAREKVDEAMALAGKMLGAASPKWQRLEVICQEYLSEHPVEPSDDDPAAHLAQQVDDWTHEAMEALERETRQWEFLCSPASVAAPVAGVEDAVDDLLRLDAELRRLAGLRDRWDELLGHLAMLVRSTWLWRDMQFVRFGQFCKERLGMAGRTVEQRAWLARRLYSLPELRVAMREGRLSYEKARLVASHATESTVAAWIARAEKVPCITLRREIDLDEERQMCARGVLGLRVPRTVRDLLSDALRAAREASGKWLRTEEAVVLVAEHFVRTWKALPVERNTPRRRVLERDGGLCQVPGCSRPAAHVHHVQYRSRGGGDEGSNLISICVAHHLHGIHLGYIRVCGRAPDALAWEVRLGPEAGPPVNVFPGSEVRA